MGKLCMFFVHKLDSAIIIADIYKKRKQVKDLQTKIFSLSMFLAIFFAILLIPFKIWKVENQYILDTIDYE